MEPVTFEIAKKLKEKGFSKYCISFYALKNFVGEFVDDCGDCYEVDFENGELYINYPLKKHQYNIEECCLPAPTISQVLKWLRETHNIHINIYFFRFNGNTELNWVFSVENIKDDFEYDVYSSKCNSYEEAALAGIENVLDNIL